MNATKRAIEPTMTLTTNAMTVPSAVQASPFPFAAVLFPESNAIVSASLLPSCTNASQSIWAAGLMRFQPSTSPRPTFTAAVIACTTKSNTCASTLPTLSPDVPNSLNCAPAVAASSRSERKPRATPSFWSAPRNASIDGFAASTPAEKPVAMPERKFTIRFPQRNTLIRKSFKPLFSALFNSSRTAPENPPSSMSCLSPSKKSDTRAHTRRAKSAMPPRFF